MATSSVSTDPVPLTVWPCGQHADGERKSGLQHTVAAMSSTLSRLEATVERVEDTVIDLCERVARLEAGSKTGSVK